ncbi:MAG TPA: protein arginine kinase, partial [Planctomycetota bacterium]|nr:protein arginine kinase [Planctomycetota bacterium]
MKMRDLAGAPGEWLKGTGPESEVVISSRIRLARNLVQFPFLSRATTEQKQKLLDIMRNTLAAIELTRDLTFVELGDTDPVDRSLLVERHLISRELADGDWPRAVAFSNTETMSVMINEEDHLRTQVLHSGLELADTWSQIDKLDDALEEKLDFAFSAQLGYLTACPTNVGTGIRVSVMLHLPALVITREIEKVFQAVAKVNLAVRGLYGEGTQASGDFYQVSNQRTLGKSEQQILSNIESVVPRIVEYEKIARSKLLVESRPTLEDRVLRAYGQLKTARTISS